MHPGCRQQLPQRTRALLRGLVLGLLAAAVVGADYGLWDRPADVADVETGWTPRSKFLVRPNTKMDYENLGWYDYREQAAFSIGGGGGFDWFPEYDQLGERWLSGASTVFSWREDRTRAPYVGSEFTKFRSPMIQHNQLVVARESFENGAFRLSMGESIRTTFTSLTLDMARFSGVRTDAVLGHNHELTMLFTRPSDRFSPTRGSYSIRPLRDNGTLLAGGHWEGRFLEGSLRLGATFVNHHRFDSMQQEGSFLLGTMPVDMSPDTVAVRFTDDMPFGGVRGGAVYDGSMTMTLRRGSGENRVLVGVRPVATASEGARWEQDHWIVDGPSYIEYTVPLPDDAVGVRSLATVAGDYRIGMRQVHRAIDPVSLEQEIRQTPLVTRSRAGGAGTAAPRQIGLEYGLSSAMNLGGLNGVLALGGMNLEWEYARSMAHFQFPEEQLGARSSYSGAAWFLRGTQDWLRVSVGGEYFRVSPKYSSYAYDSGNFREGNALFKGSDDFITAGYMGNAFGYYFNEPQANILRVGYPKRNMVFPVVEDNDDDDQYADQSQSDEPFAQRTQPLMAGVYPGWDLDDDGVPDYNRNRNHLPDYLEPFFKYWQEEQVFNWGDDFNHNGVLDYFEDDSLPDYPYYKDERGTHLFVDWRLPLRGLSLRLGRYRINQVSGSGRNHSDYAVGSFRRVFPGRGRVQWEHQIERVEDDIPNSTFQYVLKDDIDIDAEYQTDYIEDHLDMRNSLVNRGYIGTRWTPVTGLNLHNNLRYDLNHQKEEVFADGTGQESAELHTWALVNKVDYTLAWNRFTLLPMFKHTLLKQDADGGTGPGGMARRRDVTEIVPILRFDCQFTDRTSVEFGVEGFPFFKERFLDREDEARDFSSQTYLGQMKMKGVTGGFNVFIVTGLEYTKRSYDEPGMASGSFVRSFFQVFIGEAVLAAAQ